MEQTVADCLKSMGGTDIIVFKAQAASLESIRRRFRAVWCTDTEGVLRYEHFQHLGAEFWMHENWLVRLGFLKEDDNNLPGISKGTFRHIAAEQDKFPRQLQVLMGPRGVKVISFYMPPVMGEVRPSSANWLTLGEEEELFGLCCFTLLRYVQIALQGGMLWQDMLSIEGVDAQTLEKDNGTNYVVRENEVFFKRFNTMRDVSAVSLNCLWSSTGPAEDTCFVIDVRPTGTVIEDLVVGSFKPCSIAIWNGRDINRENFQEAVEDLCRRNRADILFVFNTGSNVNGSVQEKLGRLPYDSKFSSPAQGLRGGVTVLWNSSTVNIMCGFIMYGGDVNSWISVLSKADEAGQW